MHGAGPSHLPTACARGVSPKPAVLLALCGGLHSSCGDAGSWTMSLRDFFSGEEFDLTTLGPRLFSEFAPDDEDNNIRSPRGDQWVCGGQRSAGACAGVCAGVRWGGGVWKATALRVCMVAHAPPSPMHGPLCRLVPRSPSPAQPCPRPGGGGGGGLRYTASGAHRDEGEGSSTFSISFFFLRKNFSDVGRWVGQAEEPRLPFRPSPPPVTICRGLPPPPRPQPAQLLSLLSPPPRPQSTTAGYTTDIALDTGRCHEGGREGEGVCV